MDNLFQLLIAAVIALVVFRFGWSGIRYLSAPAPEDTNPDDVIEVEGSFLCTVCGMRLTVTHAQGADVAAPRHCREEMEPVSPDTVL
jgi:hypothetical protein